MKRALVAVPKPTQRELPLLETRDRLVVVGKTGMGKSTFVKRHLARELAAGRRVLFGDYHDEYSQLGAASDEVTLGPLTQRLTLEELEDDLDALDRADLSLAVVMPTSPTEAADAAAHLVELARDTGNLLLGFDEVGMFGDHCREALHVAATQSRHWGVPLILASQSLVDIHPRARRQASHFVSFRQDHPADVAAVAELTRSEAFAEAVAELRPREWLTWSDDTSTPSASDKRRRP